MNYKETKEVLIEMESKEFDLYELRAANLARWVESSTRATKKEIEAVFNDLVDFARFEDSYEIHEYCEECLKRIRKANNRKKRG